MTFRTRFNYGSNKSYHFHSDMPSMTDQRYAKDCDLSRIVGIDGGQLFIKDQQAFINAVNPHDYADNFQDVSDLGDFASMQRTMKQAEYTFQDLPSAVRDKYDNDLGKFLVALNTPVPTTAENSLPVADPVEPTPNSDGSEKN